MAVLIDSATRRFVVVAGLIAGCSAPRVCMPGDVHACSGPSRCVGTQACNATGTGYLDCVCLGTGGGAGGGSAGAGGGGSAGGTGGGAGVDAGTDAGCPLRCGAACCRYGELCGTDGGSSCVSDYDPARRPYCDACTGAVMPPACQGEANFCVNGACGADCLLGQPCPAGYSCQDVLSPVTGYQCSSSMPCPNAGECVIEPGAQFGFCSCRDGAACPSQSCSAGECTISHRHCVTEVDCERAYCAMIPTDGGMTGRCQLGRNCLPAPGLTCADLR